jgi:(R,R)-butanediol dehydrogenase/meso-butanediol dehydrogenase/diacetyl reductase
MKALVYHGKDSIALDEMKEPEVQEGEALIKVHYAGICGSDLMIWHGALARIVPPVILGHEFCGEIVKIKGQPQGDLTVGDRVAVEPLINCGVCLPCRMGLYHVCRRLRLIGVDVDGGFASWVKAPFHRIYKLAPGASMEMAALSEPTAVAVHMVRRSGLQVGDFAVILGGGPIGLLVAQVARACGAGRVFISEINDFRLGLARELGFGVIDPRKGDPIREVLDMTEGEGADVVFEETGLPEAAAQMIAMTRVRGRILLGGVHKKPAPVDLQNVVIKEIELVGSRVYDFRDFRTALDMLNDGRVKGASLITKKIRLDEIITEGFDVIQGGGQVMKILVSPE